MKVLGINGSPRKAWNTATMVNKALEGAASEDAETELIHLYDIDFKGCTSCFSCKLKGGKSYGKCACIDDLTPVLEKASEADAVIIGAPVYMRTANGVTRSFLERLLYPHPSFDPDFFTNYQKKMPTGFIYTMGASEGMVKEWHFEDPHMTFEATRQTMEWIFGYSEMMFVVDTYQYDDYSKYFLPPGTNVEEKARRREEVFPIDCEKAFAMGVRLIKKASYI